MDCPDHTAEVYLKSRQVRARYGNVSDMWLHRRLADPTSDFPRPVYLSRERFWRLSDLLAYERQCAAAEPRRIVPGRPFERGEAA